MDKEKVVSKPMELPIDDGTGDIVDKLEKQRAEIAKAAAKELKDRAAAMDEVNNAKEVKAEFKDGSGKTLKIKNVTEKLILDEGDDVLTEGLLDNDFISDVFNALSDVAYKYRRAIEHMSKDEVIDEFDEAYDWFTVHFFDVFDEELDEALPKDLAKAYKNYPFRIGQGSQKTGYSNIARPFDRFNEPREIYNGRQVQAVDTDFQNSNYEEITPEEALKLKKAGEVDKLRIIYDGQLVAFNKEGKPIYKASRSYNSPRELYDKNGRRVEHTTLLPFKDILAGASKIYKADEVAVDKELQAKRATNPESPHYVYDNTSWNGSNWRSSDEYNYVGDTYRGSGVQKYDVDRLKDLKLSINNYTDHINSLKARIADLESKEDYPTKEDEIEKLKQDLEWYTQRLNRDFNNYKEYKGRLNDYKAFRRNLSSKQNLEGVIKNFFNLKSKYKSAYSNWESAVSKLNNLKANGSPQVNSWKSDLDDAKRRLREIQVKIAKLELYLESADEDNESEISKADELVNTYLKQTEDIMAEIKALKSKKQEDFDQEVGEEELQEAKVVSAFDSYKPWSGAVDTYEKIEAAGKLDEFEALIDELYPEGIDETQLNDILWFEDDWIFETLGMGEEDAQ